jgi:hypothetical protein
MTTTMRLPAEHVAQLVDLLTVVATAADTNDEDRYQLHYCRSQVGEVMPPIEVLVLAGVLNEMTDRPGPDPAARNRCRRWSDHLARLLSTVPAATSPAPSSLTGGERRPLRLAS